MDFHISRIPRYLYFWKCGDSRNMEISKSRNTDIKRIFVGTHVCRYADMHEATAVGLCVCLCV